MNISEILNRINAVREEKGIPKMTFYKDVKITSGAITQWKKGDTHPSQRTLETIADYLGVTYEWLVAGSGDKKEKPVIPEGDELLNSPVAWATAWDQASPELRRAALAVLKSGVLSSDGRE